MGLAVALGGGSGRNLAERKEWTVDEDREICRAVRKHGFKWRLVAADVPGRSDDAVRNRYNRVKGLAHLQPTAEELAAEHIEWATLDVKPVRRRSRAGKGAYAGKAKMAKACETGSSKDSTESSDDGKDSDDKEESKVERISWSRGEDEMIVRSVHELGNKWAKIAERLSGRTEHAIRNRYARLQSLANRGNPIVLSSGRGLPIGIQLVPSLRK